MNRGAGGRGGGPATAAGTDFQARIAAWFACAILGEVAVPPTWGWSESAVVESVYAETGEAIDDLLVRNSEGCVAYIQAKYRVQLDKGNKSPLAKTLKQFVLQYIDTGKSLPDCYRFVLATSSESSLPIRSQLPLILSRIRALQNGEDIMNAAKNKAEQDTLKVVIDHLKLAWKDKNNDAPNAKDIRAILAATHVTVFDLYEDQNSLREAQSLLRTTVLQQESAAAGVWNQLVTLAAQFSIMQTGANRGWLQERLTSLGVGLRAAQSYRSDIDKLLAYSQRTVDRLADFASIRGDDGTPLTLQRMASEELQRALSEGSIIVTGDPGAGKSASIYDVASSLEDGQFVALSSDVLSSGSLGDLRNELALEHEFVEVLQNWPATEVGPYLIVDALDAARGEQIQEALLELIRSTRRYADRWTVAASVRRFDLRYNPALQDIFSTNQFTPGPFQLAEFSSIRHFNVPILTDAELDQLKDLSPELHLIATTGTEELKDLVRVPFNLRLLAELIGLHVKAAELRPIVTQLQLLDKYWERRVLAPGTGDSREAVLRFACTEMLNAKTMQVSRARLQQGTGFGESISELLSNRVIVEQESAGSVERERISFSHHVLFDYAVARLLLRGIETDILETTIAQPSLLLIARPSYDMQFRHLWESNTDRHAFWSLALTFAAATDLPAIGKIIGPTIAASEVQSIADLQPLLASLEDQGERRIATELVLRYLISARLGGEGIGQQIPRERWPVWCELVRILGQNVRAETVYAIANLLRELSANAAELETEQVQNLGAGARSLLKWLHERGVENRQLLRVAIASVVSTFASDPNASEELIRTIFLPERLAQFGYLEMPILADEVAGLSDTRPDLVGAIYETAFEFSELSDESTSLSSGVVPLSSNKRQDYAHAHYALAEFFPTFLKNSPGEAVEALAAALRAYRNSSGSEPELLAIDWLGQQVTIEPDASSIWAVGDLFANDGEVKMLNAFTDWMIEKVTTEGSAAANTIVSLLRGLISPASLWNRVLVVAAQFPEAFVLALEPMFQSASALASSDLTDAVDQYLRVAFPFFSEESRQRIENAITELPEAKS